MSGLENPKSDGAHARRRKLRRIVVAEATAAVIGVAVIAVMIVAGTSTGLVIGAVLAELLIVIGLIGLLRSSSWSA